MNYPSLRMKTLWDRQDNSPPKVLHVLIYGTYEYVTLHGKRDFADVIKLNILRWGNYTGLFRWAQYNNKGLCKSERMAGELGKNM